MNPLLTFVFILLSIEVGKIVAKDQSQIKIVDYKADYFNENYVDKQKSKLEVVKVNETYNKSHAKLVTLKDFRLDIRREITILRSPSCHGPWEQLDKFTVKLCDHNDKHRDWITSGFKSQIEGEKCLHKGTYEFTDETPSKFVELLPGKNWEGNYLKVVYILGNDNVHIATTEKCYQPNEMPTCPQL